MAAVLALVMLPLVACVGFFAGATGTASLAAVLGIALFAALGAGVLAGALRVVGAAEEASD